MQLAEGSKKTAGSQQVADSRKNQNGSVWRMA